ncbi:hypothetical protein L3Y25_gp002 [Gordonia phage Syleon]|uniref:Uncharacterized protein n=1 Tax=Gordonia phage Syleon TaxID=2653718 RepID=A0A5Q2WB77_9CAUD|nr:hypothetical protein L3Y25_gp002 [Gordonia phage Syleon]QGH75731.1 hypothetical protein SEA_SYLEON_2 [Gordonia phage Syleon]
MNTLKRVWNWLTENERMRRQLNARLRAYEAQRRADLRAERKRASNV